MKGKKTWLPVGLTCLVVLGAMLLPQSVSRARDARLRAGSMPKPWRWPVACPPVRLPWRRS